MTIKLTKIESVVNKSEVAAVYDLTVANTESYTVTENNIAVHNCTTRALTGVGYPQVSAVMETANSAHGLKGHVISDGGCRTPGDVAKAFAAGADFVMLGGMLAGHDESGGEIIEKDGKKFVKFYGMSSAEAMNKHYGGVAAHRAPEGRSILKDYKGPVENTVLEILGGVRSSATYIGAKNIKEMHKRATFVRVR